MQASAAQLREQMEKSALEAAKTAQLFA
jgi:hypothetical protein